MLNQQTEIKSPLVLHRIMGSDIFGEGLILRDGSLCLVRKGVEDIWEGAPKFGLLKERGRKECTFQGGGIK